MPRRCVTYCIGLTNLAEEKPRTHDCETGTEDAQSERHKFNVNVQQTSAFLPPPLSDSFQFFNPG